MIKCAEIDDQLRPQPAELLRQPVPPRVRLQAPHFRTPTAQFRRQCVAQPAATAEHHAPPRQRGFPGHSRLIPLLPHELHVPLTPPSGGGAVRPVGGIRSSAAVRLVSAVAYPVAGVRSSPAVRLVGTVARSRGHCSRRIHPVPLPLERVPRQPDLGHRPIPLIRIPVERHTCEPQPPDRLGQHRVSRARIPRRRQRRHDQPVPLRRAVRMPARHRAERLPRPEFQQHQVRVLQQRRERCAEPHRRAHVLGPVARAGRLLGGHQGPGHVGHVRDPGLAERDVGCDPLGQLSLGRREHARVEGVRGGQRPDRHRLGLEECPHPGDRGQLAGDHGQLAAVHRGDVQAGHPGALDPQPGVRHRQRHGGHGAGRQRADQLRPVRHQPDGGVQREHPGQAGGHVLTEAVAGHHRRLDAPRHDQPGQRVRDREHGRVEPFGGISPAGVRRAVASQQPAQPGSVRARGQHLRQRVAAVQQLGDESPALVQRGREHRLAVVEARAHPGVLLTGAGDEEADLAVGAGLALRLGSALAHPAGRVVPAGGDEHPAVLEDPAAGLQRVGDVAQGVAAGFAGQVAGQPFGHRVRRGRAARRPDQHLGARRGLRARDHRRLFQHHVRVGPADAERADAGPADPVVPPRPAGQAGHHFQPGLADAELPVGVGEVAGGRDLGGVQRERRLDQPGHAGRAVQMTHVGLDGADQALLALEHLLQRGDLDRVTQRGPGAVRLDVVDVRGGQAGTGQRLRDHRGLALDARRGEAGLAAAVVVHRPAADHRVDPVPVGQRIRQPP